jgi:hypothetical protein
LSKNCAKPFYKIGISALRNGLQKQSAGLQKTAPLYFCTPPQTG